MLKHGHWPIRIIDVSACERAAFVLFGKEATVQMRRVHDTKIGFA
jgi:hypothetical protein